MTKHRPTESKTDLEPVNLANVKKAISKNPVWLFHNANPVCVTTGKKLAD